ncbi:MAG: hypothetical protein ABSB76_06695, partial [Streptosporangiaceae bacterium]
AAAEYPAERKIAGTGLLTVPGWQPARPVPLQDISLALSPVDGGAALVPPGPADGTGYLRYSDAVRELAAPAIFEDRPTYRLTGAELAGPAPRLGFTRGRYFDGIDTGEAAAHEYAARQLPGRPAAAGSAPDDRPSPARPSPAGSAPDDRPSPAGSSPARPSPARLSSPLASLRGRLGDPCDLGRRPVNLAISTLTLRLDSSTGRASFLLHWRDPAKVAHAGGLYQVIPVGVFQPSGEAAWNERADFSLWRSMIREFAEELRGRSEDYDSENRPIDYHSWRFARRMTEALDRGQIRVWCLGLGVDPLTYATDLLAVAVIDGPVFDGLFGLNPRPNDEGRVLAVRDFAAPVIDQLVTREPVQAAGAAVLRLAWAHRQTLTG